MDLHPDVQAAAAHVRAVYELGVNYFDCSRLYWDGRAEEAYGIGLEGVRKNVFLTTKTVKRTAKEALEELETSFRLLKTDYVDLWQAHAVQNRDDIDKLLAPGGAIEAFESAKKAASAVSSALPATSIPPPTPRSSREFGVGVQAIKIFGKAFLLRSLSPTECLRYVLSLPGVHVAVCGAATQGQMQDNIRAVRNFKKMTPQEIADVQRRAIIGSGVYTGPAMEYWKKKV